MTQCGKVVPADLALMSGTADPSFGGVGWPKLLTSLPRTLTDFGESLLISFCKTSQEINCDIVDMEEGEAEGGGGPLLELSMDTFLTVYRLLPHCLLLLIGISKTYTFACPL